MVTAAPRKAVILLFFCSITFAFIFAEAFEIFFSFSHHSRVFMFQGFLKHEADVVDVVVFQGLQHFLLLIAVEPFFQNIFFILRLPFENVISRIKSLAPSHKPAKVDPAPLPVMAIHFIRLFMALGRYVVEASIKNPSTLAKIIGWGLINVNAYFMVCKNTPRGRGIFIGSYGPLQLVFAPELGHFQADGGAPQGRARFFQAQAAGPCISRLSRWPWPSAFPPGWASFSASGRPRKLPSFRL